MLTQFYILDLHVCCVLLCCFYRKHGEQEVVIVTFQLVDLKIVLFALVLFLGTQVRVSLCSPSWLKFRLLPQLPAGQDHNRVLP